MEYLYNPLGGRCSYAIGRPVNALEIRLTLSGVSRLSVHRHYPSDPFVGKGQLFHYGLVDLVLYREWVTLALGHRGLPVIAC